MPLSDAPSARSDPSFDMAARAAAREAERYGLHSRHMNEMMVRVLHTIGFDVGFRSGSGQYLYDRAGDRYLDLLSGWGVFAIGRNHPRLREALRSVIDGDLPNLVQMDLSVLAGLLAERLLALAPHLDKVFFANSGAEAVEAAIKFARSATGRPGIVHCSHAFHGLSYGALSLIGDQIFRQGFGPFVPNCVEIPFNDLAALEQALAGRQVAAFVVEPIQGKGVNIPDDDYLPAVQRLCRKYGDALRRRRDPDRARPHRTLSGGRSLGRRARYGSALQIAVRRPCSGRGGDDAQGDFRQDLRPDGPRGDPRLDLRQERSRHGRGARHARRARLRKARRKCRTLRHAADRGLRRDGASATNSSRTCVAKA